LFLLPFLGAFGTIDAVKQHRIRLTDDELGIVVSSLRARLAMSGAVRGVAIRKLIDRLSECTPGNPNWIYGDDQNATKK